MAISLNNHETRIKALESNQNGVKFSPKVLWSGSISNSSVQNTEFADYKLLIVEIGMGGGNAYSCAYPFIPSVGEIQYCEIPKPGDNGICTISMNGNTITHKVKGYTTSLTKIYGILK